MRAVVSRTVLRFGPYELNVSSGELQKYGIPLRLQPQPAKVLILLARRARELVTREEIKAELWGGETFVQFEQGLNFCIRQIRQALGDNADAPLYIETVPRRGYRFIAPVDGVLPHSSDVVEAPRQEPKAEKIGIPRRWLVLSFAFVLVLAFGLYAGSKWIASRENIANSKVMLAVLPFENMSGDQQEDYFSEGLTDEIITDLGQLQPERLGVIARTSVMQYRHTDKTISQIGRELGVNYVLEGGVSHGTNELRVNAQLIQVRDQAHLWAQSFEFKSGDVLKLQDEVAARIAGQIPLKLNPKQEARLNVHPGIDPEAHEAYLKGRYFWNRRNQDAYIEAINYFQEAITRDPNYAQAYAGLADTLALEGSVPDPVIPRKRAMPQAKAAAEHALQLDESLAEAHTSLAFVKMHYEWDWPGAEKEYQRAIQLNPSYATAHEWHAYLLIAMGKKEDAIAEMSQARALDPLSLIINTDIGELLTYKRDYDAAVKQLQSVLKMDPNFQLAHTDLGVTYLWSGHAPEAMSEFQAGSNLPGGRMWARPYLGIAMLRSGRRDEAVAVQQELEDYGKRGHVRPYTLAALDAELGEKDKAFALLEEVVNERQGTLILLRVDPAWDSLRSDPRYVDLVQKIGLR